MIIFILTVLSFFPFIFFLLPKKHLLFIVATTFLVGTSWMSYLLFLFYLAGFEFSTVVYLISYLAIAMIGWVYLFLTKRGPLLLENYRKSIKLLKLSVSEKLLILIVASVGSLLIIFNFFWPVRDWDAVTLYDYRAKVIINTGSIESLTNFDANYYFAYPLLTSVIHSQYYLLDFSSPMTYYSFLFLSFIAVFYFLIREKRSRIVSLMLSSILLVSPTLFEHSLIAYTNLPYTLLVTSGIFFLLQHLENRKIGYFYTGVLLTTISYWARGAEPFWILFPFIILLYEKNRFSKLLVFFVIIATTIFPWSVYSREALSTAVYHGTTQSLIAGLTQFDVTTIISIIKYLWINFFHPYLALHLIILSLFLFELLQGVVKKKSVYFALFTLLYLIVIGGTFYLSLTYPKWNRVGGSLTRMAMIFIPFTIYMVANHPFFFRKTHER